LDKLQYNRSEPAVGPIVSTARSVERTFRSMNLVLAACAVASAICFGKSVTCDFRAHRQLSEGYLRPWWASRLMLPLRAFSAAGRRLKIGAYCWRVAMVVFLLLAWAGSRS
jgi:hypothetical protein